MNNTHGDLNTDTPLGLGLGLASGGIAVCFDTVVDSEAWRFRLVDSEVWQFRQVAFSLAHASYFRQMAIYIKSIESPTPQFEHGLQHSKQKVGLPTQL